MYCVFDVCLICLCVYGFEGFPLWCMTWPRPHLELSLAITTEERHSSMPLVSPNTVGYNIYGSGRVASGSGPCPFLRELILKHCVSEYLKKSVNFMLKM